MKKVDFFVIGAMKAGTSSLHAILNKHPRISTGQIKEYGFFYKSKFDVSEMESYHSNFDFNKDIWGEVCPNYSKRTTFEGVAERIFTYNPSAKIIYIRRDPIKRALSETGHFFEEGEINANTRIHWFKNHRSRQWKKKNPEKSKEIRFGDFDNNPIVQNSRYEFQLDAFREFFPENQILSIEFEQLLKKPQLNLSLILNQIEPSLEWINSISTRVQFPHVHNTAKKLVPHNILMLAREQSKFFDFKHWIFRFPFLKKMLLSIGLLRALKPCFFDEKLEASLFSYLEEHP